MGGPSRAVEVWEPDTRTFSEAGTLGIGSAEPIAVRLLPDHRVLIGHGTTAQVWDPVTMLLTPAGVLGDTPEMPEGELLRDGRVLSAIDASVQTWDPRTGSIASAGSLPSGHHAMATALLNDGRVVIVVGVGDEVCTPDATQTASLTTAGLFSCSPPPLSADIWDPVDGTITATGASFGGFSDVTATALLDGRVLLVGREAAVLFELSRMSGPGTWWTGVRPGRVCLIDPSTRREAASSSLARDEGSPEMSSDTASVSTSRAWTKVELGPMTFFPFDRRRWHRPRRLRPPMGHTSAPTHGCGRCPDREATRSWTSSSPCCPQLEMARRPTAPPGSAEDHHDVQLTVGHAAAGVHAGDIHVDEMRSGADALGEAGHGHADRAGQRRQRSMKELLVAAREPRIEAGLGVEGEVPEAGRVQAVPLLSFGQIVPVKVVCTSATRPTGTLMVARRTRSVSLPNRSIGFASVPRADAKRTEPAPEVAAGVAAMVMVLPTRMPSSRPEDQQMPDLHVAIEDPDHDRTSLERRKQHSETQNASSVKCWDVHESPAPELLASVASIAHHRRGWPNQW